MKTLPFVVSFVLMIATIFTAHAQKASLYALQKDNIKVWGECGMCKKKIEKAALTAGVETASWNEDSKILQVAFKAGKTDALKIQEAVAAAGYDTKAVTASTSAYKSLPGCCHYQRKETSAAAAINCCSNTAGTAMDCNKEADCCKDGKCAKDKDKCMDKAACKEKGCSKS